MEQLPQVGFKKSFVLFWKNYVNFTGRSRRSEYWYMMLWHLIFLLPAFFVFLMGIIFLGIGEEVHIEVLSMFGVMIFILTVIYMFAYFLATIIPNLALSVRRFHDISRTMVLPIIMFAYGIVFSIVAQCIESYYDNDLMYMPIGILILLILLYLIYFGLSVTMIVFLCFDSKPANKYGESPKYPSTIKKQPEAAGTSETLETPKTPEETDNQL
ncbi:DUF805 domain-containing protein [Staphylococcus sp. SS251]|nr:DUF805 domain-containing protein [Staphylococcus singaporensis]MBE5678180.1 DUF805 domain-containing protein [Staphylococcus singaporensis]UMT77820.1 DUF805 domain-containing protein [Staphylococcus roterodami]